MYAVTELKEYFLQSDIDKKRLLKPADFYYLNVQCFLMQIKWKSLSLSFFFFAFCFFC